ncbi:Leucine rich repeat [Popillia japonica]|uniref:Leucine rich repeat n=1 Tax=Popillia japonica TaxID=7064 RepID=A0AAW1JHT0_POPJA
MLLFPLILVMVSLAAMAMDYECPERCTCEQIPRYNLPISPEKVTVHARCRSPFNVTQLPDALGKITFENSPIDLQEILDDLDYGFPAALTSLDFTNCSFNAANVTFSSEQITHLSFRNSDLSSTVLALNLTNLDTLDLSNDKIKVFKYMPYRTLSNLQVLNLSANGAHSIKDGYFAGLSDLKCLDLSNNNLSILNDKILLPLSNLQYLNLSNNRLEVLNEACFSSLLRLQQLDVSNLQYLNLSNNRLEVLNEACFSSLLRLQQLDVSWNRLAKVVPGNLELPSLARLLLAGNPRLGNSRKPTLLVGTGRRLQTVDASRRRLQTVDASRTGLKQVPAALTHSIRTLRLAGNSIKTINCGDLDTYPLLQVLDFASNELKQIEDDALGRLDSLTVLYLTDNKLSNIPKSLPEKLKVLHLERNRIKIIQSNDFQNLNQLETLLLCDNKIATIQENAFNYLFSIVSLDLSRNPLEILPPGMLTTSGKLEILRLSGIPALPQLEEATFPLTSTEYLIILDLSKSPGLAHQLLEDTAALIAARELQELNLADTDIEYVRSDILHYLPQLRLLHLQGNPLNCTNLYWLAVWMRKQDEDVHAKVTCASPAEFWSIPLVDLQEATFPLTSTEYLIILDLSKSPGLAHQLLEDTAALIAARELQELNLADTDIEYVRSDILHYLPQLRLLHLQGNPLNCTNLYWLAVWMRKQDEDVHAKVTKQDEDVHAKVTCASPAEFWSIPLVDLQEIEGDKVAPTTEKISEQKSSTKFDYNFSYFEHSPDLNLIKQNNSTITEIKNSDRNNSDNKTKEFEVYESENATTSTGKLAMYCVGNDHEKILALRKRKRNHLYR